MDISDFVSTSFETFDIDTRVSRIDGAIRETGAKAVIITDDGEYEGVITQRRLATAQRNPDMKAGRLVWHVATVERDADVRAVARLMVGSDSMVLPVVEKEELVGVVTAETLLANVQPFLQVLTVGAIATMELIAIAPDATLGEALHTLREQRITHLPIVEDDDAVGIVSLYDLLEFTAREVQQTQGGSPAPSVQTGGGRSHGGFGERAGDIDRLLDLPVENVMTTPTWTTTAETPLDEAVGTMLENSISSLVVTEDASPAGILTTTDVLQTLTLTDEQHIPVQITNIDLLDDISRAEVTELIENVTRKYRQLQLLEANVYLHKHDETLRGTPLIMARIRLFTDKGHFVGTGEGYGASHALHLARNVVERKILEGKEYARTKKHPTGEELAKMYGWWLLGSPRQR